jgi:hypothetical protein
VEVYRLAAEAYQVKQVLKGIERMEKKEYVDE